MYGNFKQSTIRRIICYFLPCFLLLLGGRKAFMMGNKSGVDSRTKEFIRNEISTQDVVIFSKSYCPYCSKTKQLFSGPVGKDYSVKVVELDKLKDGNDIQDELLSMTGQRTVPNVFIKGKHLGGNDDTHAALASGKLQAMLSALSGNTRDDKL